MNPLGSYVSETPRSPVGLGLVSRFRAVARTSTTSRSANASRLDLGGGELAAGDLMAELAFERLALPLRLGDPLGGDLDDFVVVEQGAVLGELAVAFGDAGSELCLALGGLVVGLGVSGEHVRSHVDVFVVELCRQPGVEAGSDCVSLT
jgi:hypothetical protein